MKRDLKLVLAVIIFLLLLITPIHSQTIPSNQSPVLLEFVRISCSRDCDRENIRVYADGRYTSEAVILEESKSGKLRKVTSKTEKQLEPSEVAELVGWAEQPDFLKAQPEYVKIVTDQPDYITITYRNNGLEKKVIVANYYSQTAEEKAKIPASVMKLLRWTQLYGFQ